MIVRHFSRAHVLVARVASLALAFGQGRQRPRPIPPARPWRDTPNRARIGKADAALQCDRITLMSKDIIDVQRQGYKVRDD